MTNQTDALRPALGRFQQIALIVGVVGAVLGAIGAFMGPAQFFQSYLFAYFFWIGLAIGSAILLMIQHLTSGVWGLMLRRLLEASVLTLPLMGVLFIPIVLGSGYLYEWTHADVVAKDAVLQAKSGYLNLPFFIARAVIYFVVWSGIAYLLNRWSAEQDRAPSEALSQKLRNLSGPGIVVVVLLWTLAATDWGMSLEPHWFSSMYPVTFLVGYMLMTFAAGIIALSVLSSRKLLPFAIPVDRLHDLGKFLFAFVVLWAYINFSQYLIIWSANIPEETPWHGHRSAGGWEYFAIALIIGHFFLPFFLLLSRHVKRNMKSLTVMAVYVMVIELIFVFWSIIPSFYPEGVHMHWLDLVALLGIGGLWLAMFARNLRSKPFLPVNDPRVEELRQQNEGHGHGKAKAAH